MIEITYNNQTKSFTASLNGSVLEFNGSLKQLLKSILSQAEDIEYEIKEACDE
jgi:hypothetical protein